MSMAELKRTISELLKDESGATSLEYCALLCVVAAINVRFGQVISQQLSNLVGDIVATLG